MFDSSTDSLRMRSSCVGPAQDEDFSLFADLVRLQVRPNYPGLEETYAASLWEDAYSLIRNEATPIRTIWRVRNRVDVTGFVVATEKRNNSLKIGPVVQVPEYTGTGSVALGIRRISEYYAAHGKHHLYGTYPASSNATERMADSLGWHVCGRLSGLYRDAPETLAGVILPTRTDLHIDDTVDQWSYSIKRGGSVRFKIPAWASPGETRERIRHYMRLVPSGRLLFTVTRSSHVIGMAEDTIALLGGERLVAWRP